MSVSKNTHDEVTALLALSEERYERLLKILTYESKDIQGLLDFAMHEAIGLTRSMIGYIYYYSEKTKQFTLNSWSKEVMKQCSIRNPSTKYELEKTGLWGEAVRQRKAILVNDFKAPSEMKKGYPHGHAPLLRFMTVPIFDHKQIVAVVGLANKVAEYTDEDVKQLELFMAAVWLIVKQKKAEESLLKKTEELEKMNKLMIGRELKMRELKEKLKK